MLDMPATLEKIKNLAMATGKMQAANQNRKDLRMEIKSSPIDLVTEIDKKAEQAIGATVRICQRRLYRSGYG